jgi:hypothetical protein
MLCWPDHRGREGAIYQIFHLWHWLTYGQNASGVQAVAAVVATVAAITAALYAKGAFREAREQVVVANSQLDVAHKQALKDSERLEMERASHMRNEQQLQIMLEEARENRDRNTRERQDARLQREKEEDQTRPRFSLGYSGSAAAYDIALENVGGAVARNIECSNRQGEILAQGTAVQVGAKFQFRTPKPILEAGFIVKFETDQGSRYIVDLKLGRHPQEEIVSISRGY